MSERVALDLETTGLNPNEDAIIEIGVVRFQGDNIIEEWRSLIKPDRPIPHNVSELTGIHEEDVQREGITLQEAIHRLQKLIGKLSIVGHNINFDLNFLRL